MTAIQLAGMLNIKPFTVMSSLRQLTKHGLMMCLTPDERQSRIYWLTQFGERVQRELRQSEELKPLIHDVPELDWTRYTSVCFSHRAVIVCVLTQPLTPVDIKRHARRRYPWIRMSTNNVRDAVKLLRQRNIIEPVISARERYPRYVLTQACREFPRLLQRVVWRRAP